MKRLLWIFLIVPTFAQAYEPGKFYWEGKTKEKVIALTFDDGPGKWTIPILAYLKGKNIKATFFMEGIMVETYPEIAKQVFTEGHEIGNHTYQHFDYHKIKNEAPTRLLHELEQTDAAIERAVGQRTQIVRMPHGYYNKTWLMKTLKSKNYALVHWSFGTDWLLKKSAEQMAQEYVAAARPGAVFLFHDGGRNREKTFNAVKTVVETLQQKGYRFVAARDLFSPASSPIPVPAASSSSTSSPS